MASSKAKESAVQKWIDSATGLPSFSRHTTANLETRTIAGAELYYEGFYGSIVAAAKALGVPYKRLYYRVNGHHSTAENGGNRALLDPSDEEEVFCWAHRRITQGHHIQGRALQQHANAILKAKGVGATASRAWAKRFIQRHRELFHRRRAAARDIKRKAMQDRIHNTWNFDETGFMVGYLHKGTFIWTFREIDTPILSDAHDTVPIFYIISKSFKTRSRRSQKKWPLRTCRARSKASLRAGLRQQDHQHHRHTRRLDSTIQLEQCFNAETQPLYDSEKARKADKTLALNGITATAEMTKIKEKQAKRSSLQQQTTISPETNTIDKRHKKRRHRESGIRRISITEAKIRDIRGLWAKGDKRAHLNCNEWMCASYRILRELHNRGVGQSKAIMWPEYYDREIVKEAVELVVMEANKRAICRQTLPLEADGIEMR
ncbi:Tc5 transposase DNA-binding domain-containing protein [Hirsutella rhossiliensis]